MSASSDDDLALSTIVQTAGETPRSEQARRRSSSMIDGRPVFRCDLPLPTRDEMADDGGAAALISRSRKLNDSGKS